MPRTRLPRCGESRMGYLPRWGVVMARILAEKFGDEYRDYQRCTPCSTASIDGLRMAFLNSLGGLPLWGDLPLFQFALPAHAESRAQRGTAHGARGNKMYTLVFHQRRLRAGPARLAHRWLTHCNISLRPAARRALGVVATMSLGTILTTGAAAAAPAGNQSGVTPAAGTGARPSAEIIDAVHVPPGPAVARRTGDALV